MTASITRFCKKFSWILLCLAMAAFQPALAADITIEHAELVPGDEAYHLNARFGFDFNAEIEEAINKGVALNFLVEFALMEPHHYWFDEEVTSASQTIKLSYHALSRQYLVNVGTHQASYPSFQEAVQALSRIKDWAVVDKSLVKKGIPYYAMLRMRLDVNSLPKPLQVSSIGSDKWDLVSERHRWTPNFDKPALEKPNPDK
jgi:hypothetical protein